MVKIEVQSADVNVREGEFEDGRKWTSRQQTVYVYLPGKPYPVEARIKLGPEAQPYSPGMYQLAPESIEVYRGQLQVVRRPTLRPLQQQQQGERPKAVSG